MSTLRHIGDLPGRRFPAGRVTRVLVGPGASEEAEGFVCGVSLLDPGGAVPEHRHVNEEVYLVLAGSGTMTVDGVDQPVTADDYVYLRSQTPHALRAGEHGLRLLFVYAPAGLVGHWAEEEASGG